MYLLWSLLFLKEDEKSIKCCKKSLSHYLFYVWNRGLFVVDQLNDLVWYMKAILFTEFIVL